MSDTEQFTQIHAPHIDGLAYSQCPDDDTVDYPDVVDYPEYATFNTPLDTKRERIITSTWAATAGVCAAVMALAVTLLSMLIGGNSPRDVMVATPPKPPMLTSPPVKVTDPPPPPTDSQKTAGVLPPAPIPPPALPPPAQHVDNPDHMFATSWNEQMPHYPFPDYKCAEFGRRKGCWLHLDDPSPTNPEFVFTGKGRCTYISNHPITGITGAAHELRDTYTDMTSEQSYALATLAVRAYCPQYE